VARDQRYCLSCGTRVRTPPVDWRGLLAPPPAATPPPVIRAVPAGSSPRLAAALVVAALGAGTVIGAAAGPRAQNAPAAARYVIALAPAAVAPPASAMQTPAPVATADLPDDEPEPAAAPEAPAERTAGEPATPAAAASGPTPTHEPTPKPTPEPTPEPPPEPSGPAAKHVVIVSLTGHTAAEAFDAGSRAPYLNSELPAQGVLLRRYHPTGSGALANGLALLTGRPPTPETATDCPVYGDACRSDAPSLPGELADSARSWKAYAQGAGAPCRRPAEGPDPWRDPRPGDDYAAFRVPFLYLEGLDADCAGSVVDLAALPGDFSATDLAPALAYVVPDLCHSGAELPCPDVTGASGLERADAWLREWIPQITASPAFQDDGLLVVLFDGGGVAPATPGAPPPATGALVISSFSPSGTVSRRAYDHLSLLRTLAGTFGVDPPGRAARAGVHELGEEVFPSDNAAAAASPTLHRTDTQR
jgi:Phosphoesterase family